MKITIAQKPYKITKIVKPIKGDMYIHTGTGENTKPDTTFFVPCAIIFNFYAIDPFNDPCFCVAYQSEEGGTIEYADLSFNGITVNYKHYKKVMELLGKEPVSFTDHILQVYKGENNDTTIWEDQIK